MATVKVRLEGGEELLKQLEQMGVNVRGLLQEAALAGAEVIRAAANLRAPGPHVELGEVEQTKDRLEVTIGPDKEHWYYRFFELGAGPHTIKGKPLLVFPGARGLVVTPVVQHPGMAARPFLRPVLDEGADDVTEAVGQRVRGALPAG